MKSNKKKAFTLTELLVVVIVIGVLSAAVLPKFSKVIETRKTTEAEELMASVRTEQEKRCALDKQYLTQLSEMTDIVKNNDTKNFTITLAERGIDAASKGKYNYTLKMPSYADGRICCDGTECNKLNKNYPTCEELKGKPDYQESPADCAGETPAPSCDGSHYQGEKSVKSCECGTVSATWSCNASTGYVWKLGAYPACPAKPSAERKACGDGYTGEQTRIPVCKNGVWTMSSWSGECTPVCDMNSDAVRYRAQNCEKGGHNPNWIAGHWSEESCSCECPANTSIDEEGACISACNNVDGRERCEDASHTGHTGVWNFNTCSCDCPEGTTLDSYGQCSFNQCRAELTPAVYERAIDICKNGSEKNQRLGIAVAGFWDENECYCRCAEGYGANPDGEGGCYRDNCSTLRNQGSSSAWRLTAGYCEELPSGFKYGLKRCERGYYCTGKDECDGMCFAIGKWNAEKCQCNCPKGSYLDDYNGKLICRVSSKAGVVVDENEFWDDEFPDRDDWMEYDHSGWDIGDDEHGDEIDWGGW